MGWQRDDTIAHPERLFLRNDIHAATVVVVIRRSPVEDGGTKLSRLLHAHGLEVYLQGLDFLGVLVDDGTDVAAAPGIGGHYGIKDGSLAAGVM